MGLPGSGAGGVVCCGRRVVFHLAGNKYRLVVWINDDYLIVYVRFIGTHKQYDRIDVQTIS